MKKVYLKSPYFRIIKNGESNFCMQSPNIDNGLIQGDEVSVCDARQCIIRQIKQVHHLKINQVPFFVLNQLFVPGRHALKLLVKNEFNVEDPKEITLLEFENPAI